MKQLFVSMAVVAEADSENYQAHRGSTTRKVGDNL